MSSPRPPAEAPLAVTMGDPAGIGAEIILKAWLRRGEDALAPFVVFADADLMASRARFLSMSVPIATVSSPIEALDVFPVALPVLPVPLAASATPGRPDSANAAATIAAIEHAVRSLRGAKTRAVVTAPIAKSVLYEAGFRHPGHTEFLASLASVHWPGKPWKAVMMLACDALRVVPVTIHFPLKDVPARLTGDLICETVRITSNALQTDFGIAQPRIAVTGLNPHAGEGGSMGREEIDTIIPALAALRSEGIAVTGPHPADTLFHAAARKTYDAAVAMYHDQALIPIKTLAFDEGVNVTLGLPFVRTSPDHGTAFGIAAAGRADPASFIAAVKLADRMARQRLAAGAA